MCSEGQGLEPVAGLGASTAVVEGQRGKAWTYDTDDTQIGGPKQRHPESWRKDKVQRESAADGQANDESSNRCETNTSDTARKIPTEDTHCRSTATNDSDDVASVDEAAENDRAGDFLLDLEDDSSE